MEAYGYPPLKLSDHKPFRWFALSDESLADDCANQLDLIQFDRDKEARKPKPRPKPKSREAYPCTVTKRKRALTLRRASRKDYSPSNDNMLNESDAMDVDMAKCSSTANSDEKMETGALDNMDANTEGNINQQILLEDPNEGRYFPVSELQPLRWVELHHSDVSENFDNTLRSHQSHPALTYRCGNADCFNKEGVEWSFQVLEQYSKHSNGYSMYSYERYSRAAPSTAYGDLKSGERRPMTGPHGMSLRKEKAGQEDIREVEPGASAQAEKKKKTKTQTATNGRRRAVATSKSRTGRAKTTTAKSNSKAAETKRGTQSKSARASIQTKVSVKAASFGDDNNDSELDTKSETESETSIEEENDGSYYVPTKNM
ncbi:hypothetical protein BJ878DRAFT_503790 [Calycina marina]|uniref:Uncharacterized protein n=1 Tax=Calycina marina TaxID=1763456 RepID=A0A9P7Z427_9HELO|nr:hypothetical protein BJ878DRAFT_503790 [Calycina marina]